LEGLCLLLDEASRLFQGLVGGFEFGVGLFQGEVFLLDFIGLLLDKVSLLADFSVLDGEGDEAYEGDAECEEGEVALGFSMPKP